MAVQAVTFEVDRDVAVVQGVAVMQVLDSDGNQQVYVAHLSDKGSLTTSIGLLTVALDRLRDVQMDNWRAADDEEGP